MAQGVLPQRQMLVREREPRAAVKPTIDALRYGRTNAWMRAQGRALRRSIIEPLFALLAAVSLKLAPASYQLWRFACTFVYVCTLASEAVSGAAVTVGRNLQGAIQNHDFTHTLRRLQASLMITCCAIVIFTYGFYGMALEVILDGQSLGYVRNQSEFERAVVHVNTRASELLNAPYAVSPNVTYRFSLVNRSELFDANQVEALLFGQIPDLSYQYVLSIDGTQTVGVAQREILENALSSKLEAEAKDYNEVSFLQDVSVSYQLAPKKLETTESELNRVLDSEILPATYATLEAANATEAARSYGMNAETLLSMNPQLVGAESLEGKQVLLNYATPLLQIQGNRVEVYEEVVPYEIEYIDDSSLYIGRSLVLTQGVDGVNRITADVAYVDGREYNRDVLSVESTLAPVTHRIARGTTQPPTFIRPYYGKLSSGFKTRYLFGVSRMHTGIDLSGPIGSPVVASCAGTVTYVGSYSAYGLTVQIDHGHGISTLYAHNSALLVKVGQVVKQGEQIAKVGNTGRSTGPHVHFEVRINGEPVDPLNYV